MASSWVGDDLHSGWRSLRHLHRWSVLACGISVCVACEPPPPPVLGALPDFELTDSRGRPFGTEQLAGCVYLANFFFTRCTTLCPALTRSMSSLLRRYRERGVDGIHLVSISVDGQHDTPEKLSEFASRHAIDPQGWTLLTGTPDQLRALLIEGFRVPLGRPVTDERGLMDIAHAERLVLVDRRGRVRGYYGSDDHGLDELFQSSLHVLEDGPPPGRSTGVLCNGSPSTRPRDALTSP